MKTAYNFLGAAGTMYLGLGVKPNQFEVINLATGLSVFKWNLGMRANPATAGGVIHRPHADDQLVAQTIAQGVAIDYEGGDLIATASANYVIPYTKLTPSVVSAYAGSATTFTMDTAANATGHINAAMGTGAGAGSKIVLKWRDQWGNVKTWVDRITALTSTGLSSDYMTLSVGCPLAAGKSADIAFIGPAYDLVQAPVGQVMPQGVTLINTTYLTSAVMYEIVLLD